MKNVPWKPRLRLLRLYCTVLQCTPALFLATFRIAKYFGNAGNWVFWLEFLQNPWVLGKFHWVFREFFKIYDNFCKILNTASIYVQFLGQIMPEIFLLGLSLSFWIFEFFRLEFFLVGGQKKGCTTVMLFTKYIVQTSKREFLHTCIPEGILKSCSKYWAGGLVMMGNAETRWRRSIISMTILIKRI